MALLKTKDAHDSARGRGWGSHVWCFIEGIYRGKYQKQTIIVMKFFTGVLTETKIQMGKYFREKFQVNMEKHYKREKTQNFHSH